MAESIPKQSQQNIIQTLDLAVDVLKKRFEIVNTSNAFSSEAKTQISSFYQNILKMIQEKQQQNELYENQEFFGNLIIAASRAWEALQFNEEQQPRFGEWILEEENVMKMISDDYARCQIANQYQYQINEISEEKKYKQSLEKELFKNLVEVNIIAQQNIKEENLKQFITEQKILHFKSETPGIANFLDGLSSWNGQIIYLNDAFKLNNNKTLNNLEHEVMHNLPRWIINQTNDAENQAIQCVMLISAEKNSNLRINNKEMVESGDFYTFKVYKKLPTFISPFCLSNSQYHQKF